MSIIDMFRKKDPLSHEQKGDTYFASGAWGNAKLEYETALSKTAKGTSSTLENGSIIQRLESKIRESEEALAVDHKENGEAMMAAEYFEDAREYFQLASTLTRDPELSTAIGDRLREIDGHFDEKLRETMPALDETQTNADIPDEPAGDDDYFAVLCSTLPDAVRDAYMGYGLEFKTGYIALNRGDFQVASEALRLAMEQHPDPANFIPLELATAYLNLELYADARQLLEDFLPYHPDALPAYHLLCEVLWETGDFDAAEALLATLPDALRQSVACYLLRGETMLLAGKTGQADVLYADFLTTYGWNEQIARALAQVRETAGEIEKARDLYAEIIGQCQSCGSQTDPYLKRKYADLSVLAGQDIGKVLELYFSLVREDPAHAAEYYQTISGIYDRQGDPTEARRYRLIAEGLDRSQ